MCGITGYTSYRNKPKREILTKMLTPIVHRGPDQRGMYVDGYTALGIQRLSIIDLKSGDQPMYNETRSLVIVFNGEIYNYKDLRKDLKKKGHQCSTKSDTEILVHLYEQYGTRMVEHLNGMFAFAIWDKIKKELFLARDESGIKPLYYYHKNKTLIFASELKSILAHPDVTKELSLESLELYINFGYVPTPYSIFKNIYKLPPGTTCTFSSNGKRIQKQVSRIANTYGENLDDLLQSAVSLQAIADVPVGIFLSGGLDSSLLSYYLTKQGHKKIKTFSISFKESTFDESKYAKEVSEFLGTNHYSESFLSKDVPHLFSEIIPRLDEPLADPSLFPTYKVSARARKHVKVALSGDGGDELFGGYPTYQGHLYSNILERVPQNMVDGFITLLSLAPKSYNNYPISHTLQILLEATRHPLLKRHLGWMSPGLSSNKPRLRSSSHITNTFISDLTFHISKQTLNPQLQVQLLDYATYLRDNLLVKVDRASMLNSLEVRVPFLDPRIITYAFSRPNAHVSYLTTKKLLRKISEDKFSKAITQRKKKGFGIPVAGWINNELRDFVDDRLESPILFDYVYKKDIRKLHNAHKEKKENNAKVLWSLVVLSEWLRCWNM